MSSVGRAVALVAGCFGYDIVIRRLDKLLPSNFDREAARIIAEVRPYTMTSPERLYGLIEAVRYVVGRDIQGSVVECGVWKGGSMMAAALALQSLSCYRDLFLYDTFEGMPLPTERDVSLRGESARVMFRRYKGGEKGSGWARASLEEVRQAMTSTGYPSDRIHFVMGRVEDTIPLQAPDTIAVLRLDTDWYASTRHELHHLYPRLSYSGVLIVDDYGHWKGAREAVDEYFHDPQTRVLLSRLDYTGRMGVKF